MRRAMGSAEERGNALLAALFVVVVLAVLSLAYLDLSLTKNRENKMSVDAKRAFYIAEAGLSEAYLGLVIGKSGNVGSPAAPAKFGNGILWVEAKDEGEGRVSLTSTGLCGAGRQALSVVVERQAGTVAALGVFADERLTVGVGATIDAYDSRLGPYTPPVFKPELPPTSARTGCNRGIVVQGPPVGSLSPPTTIYGEARPGPQNMVFRSGTTVITGSTAPTTTATPLPPIAVPEAPFRGSVSYDLPSPPLAIPAGESAYGSMRILAGAKAVITGPATVVVDSLQVDPGAELSIDGSAGQVKLYVKDYLNLTSGSTVSTPAADPRKVSLLVTASQTLDRDGDGIADPPARFLSTGDFHGSAYAPAASLSVPPELQWFGAIAASRLTVQGGGRVHFDLAFTAPMTGEGELPALLGWRLVELPKTALVSLRYDPIQILKVNGITPLATKDAHYDIGVAPPPDTGGALAIR